MQRAATVAGFSGDTRKPVDTCADYLLKYAAARAGLTGESFARKSTPRGTGRRGAGDAFGRAVGRGGFGGGFAASWGGTITLRGLVFG